MGGAEPAWPAREKKDVKLPALLPKKLLLSKAMQSVMFQGKNSHAMRNNCTPTEGQPHFVVKSAVCFDSARVVSYREAGEARRREL